MYYTWLCVCALGAACCWWLSHVVCMLSNLFDAYLYVRCALIPTMFLHLQATAYLQRLQPLRMGPYARTDEEVLEEERARHRRYEEKFTQQERLLSQKKTSWTARSGVAKILMRFSPSPPREPPQS